MRSRIYAVPVFKRHWAFCVQSHKSRNPIKSAADSVNSIAESSQPSSRDSNTTSTRTSWSHRVQTIVQKTTNKVKKEWEEIETAQPGTFKYNLAQISKEILSRQDPIESFLKDVSLLYDNDNDDNNRAANTTSTLTKPQLEVVYPSSLDERLIRRRIRLIANKRLKQHMYWGLASAALIPLSAALTIIPGIIAYLAPSLLFFCLSENSTLFSSSLFLLCRPTGPNVVLAYNAFRLYSHYKAYNGMEN
eukprot:GEZU01009897.1.p1 GENE.GEZU01009897.1~~GEZU01009897.1.p1  ORF type:complete len:247 (-),score=15.47 GEZU01009897.1:371-1111(-)